MPGGKQGYINGVLNAPPVKGVETQEILVAGCTKVLWYWIFTGIGTAEYEVSFPRDTDGHEKICVR